MNANKKALIEVIKARTFTDVEFMTGAEKLLVLKQWITFVSNGFQRKHWTKRLYHHLTLHCSFIAHFSIHGFYEVYFMNSDDTVKIIKQFTEGTSVEYGYRVWLDGDYNDINTAMCDVMLALEDIAYEHLFYDSDQQTFDDWDDRPTDADDYHSF